MSLFKLCCIGLVSRRGKRKRRKIRDQEEAERRRLEIERRKRMEEENAKKAAVVKFDILTPSIMEYLSKYIGYEWNLLAFNLNLTRDEIAKIECKHKDNKQKNYQMLILWLDRHDGDKKRMRSLVTALERSGRKDLAQKMHCAQWSEQSFSDFEMPTRFPMLVRINKVRPRTARSLSAPVINDLNPTTCNPVHSLNPRFIAVM